jgi:hypothetical protein
MASHRRRTGIERAVITIHAILAASARPDPARIIDTTAEP